MLITPKEFEACTNSPSPIRSALTPSPLPPALVPFSPSLALHHYAFFFFLPLYSQNLLLRLLPAGIRSK